MPENIGEFCLARRTRLAANALTRAYNAYLKPVDIKITQFFLLAIIHQEGAMSALALAERCDVEHSALLRNVKILERRGLLSSDGGRGRNGRRTCLTTKGLALLEQAAPLWQRAQADFSAALGGRTEELRRTLAGVEKAAHDMTQPEG
ncbi:MAG TPA: MarR family transcriptional regulator [Stellaceae bacterium]|nr:MarR family transcriptional regulator [Stellaceae bacterium]